MIETHHILREPAVKVVHVPWMDEHGRADGGAKAQEGDQLVRVQIAGAHVVADLYAHVASGHRALHFQAGVVDALERHLAQGEKTALRVAGRAHLERGVVEVARHVQRDLWRPLPLKEDGRGANELQVHACLIHVGDASGRIPAGARHRTELALALHEHRVARTAVPERPRRLP